MPLLEDLVQEYEARGLSREAAVRAIINEIDDLAPPSARRVRPPTPRRVVEKVAEAAPPPLVKLPGGSMFQRITPGGATQPQGWRPPGIRPTSFHRGYWTAEAGGTQILYRGGQAVNEWDVSTTEGREQAQRETTDFVKKWPIAAERSVFTGGRR